MPIVLSEHLFMYKNLTLIVTAMTDVVIGCLNRFANRPLLGRRLTQAIFFGLGGLCLLVVPVTKAVFGYTLDPEAAKGLAIAGEHLLQTSAHCSQG